MDLKIKGKNAFITGGTRGLGLASLKQALAANAPSWKPDKISFNFPG